MQVAQALAISVQLGAAVEPTQQPITPSPLPMSVQESRIGLVLAAYAITSVISATAMQAATLGGHRLLPFWRLVVPDAWVRRQGQVDRLPPVSVTRPIQAEPGEAVVLVAAEAVQLAQMVLAQML